VQYSQVLRTVAFSTRKTLAAEDRHPVDFRGMLDTSVDPYGFDYWSILTTLLITGLHFRAYGIAFHLRDQSGRKDHSVATIGLDSKIVELRFAGVLRNCANGLVV
jgi:hypothetical protein